MLLDLLYDCRYPLWYTLLKIMEWRIGCDHGNSWYWCFKERLANICKQKSSFEENWSPIDPSPLTRHWASICILSPPICVCINNLLQCDIQYKLFVFFITITCYFFYIKIFLPKLVIYMNHLKVSYQIHNATLISNGVMRMIFCLKGNMATDTSEGIFLEQCVW